jgi:transcription antitermination factor NusG
MAGAGDQRDHISWVALELTRQGEMKVAEGIIEGLLRDALDLDPDHPMFVPSTTYLNRGERTTITLMEGYVFVASGLPEARYFSWEKANPYVKKVLSETMRNGMRILRTVPDSNIEELKRQLASKVSSDIETGMNVFVLEGVYANLEGVVLDVRGDLADVRFEMRSLDIIVPLPRVCLSPIIHTGDES